MTLSNLQAILVGAVAGLVVASTVHSQEVINRQQAMNIRAIYNCIGNPSYAGKTPHDESTLIRAWTT